MTLRAKLTAIATSIALVIASVTVPTIAKSLDELRQESAEYEEKINAKKSEIAALEAELSRISGEVASYQNAIAIINYEIQLITERIAVTQAEYDDLQVQIERLELEIENNKDALGHTLRELYNTKNISLIERLASSHNFSSFIDKEAQLDNISATLSDTVATIESDKADLEVKQQAAEQKLADLAVQKSEQDTKKQEQQALLNYSAQQQAEYGNKKRTADSEREKLEAAQREIIKQIALATGAGDPNKGGYKWANRCPSSGWTDNWNMYICQCVSYTSWKVHEQYLIGNARFDMPVWGGNWSGGLHGGNAGQWIHNAEIAGIPYGSTPKVNSVGVIGGNPGHVVWVERVNSNGTIYVSEYNGTRDRDYSETTYRTSSFLGFIYFNER